MHYPKQIRWVYPEKLSRFISNEWCKIKEFHAAAARSSVFFKEMEVSANERTIESFEDTQINLNEDCRICLRRCNEACQLFQNGKDVPQKLMAFAAVQVEEGDGLPSIICYPCYQLLDVSYDFQCQIQKADIKLREILKLRLCPAKDITKALKVENNFSDISNAILHKKIINDISNETRMCSDTIDEPSIQLDVQSFSNDQHVFTSDIINDNVESNDKCNSIIVPGSKQETRKHKQENITVPQSCDKIANKSNSETCQQSSLITGINCIKEELSHDKNSSESYDNSIDQSPAQKEQIFKTEIKNDTSSQNITYNTLSENSSKNITVPEEKKSIDNCSDDEEKPLINRTSRQKCPHCIKTFATRLALQRHMIVHKHKTKLRYVCYICDKQFSSIAKLKNHIFNRHETHTNKKGEKENTSENKDVYLKTEHVDSNCNNSVENSKNEKRNCKFTCKVCSKQFTYQKSFFTHAKSHSEYKSETFNNLSSEMGTQLNEIKSKSAIKQNELDDGNNDDEMDNDNEDDDNDNDNENDNDNDNLPMESPQCTQCGKLFATKRNLKRHISTHSGLKYNCSTCGKGFSRIDKLKDHEQSKHKDEIFGNSEEENDDDTDNENKANDSSNDRKKGRHNRPHKCAMCPKAFAQQQSLANHIERHKRVKDSQKRFLCEVCSKCFAQSGSLVAHMRTHTGIKPYVCNVCSRAFTKSTYLQLHLRTHSGEKPYICQYCSRAFARANTLARHITMHTGEAKYHCQICTKSFRRLTSLNEHTYTHTGQRPYACKICTKRYNNAGSLYAHTKKCKAQQLSNPTTTFTLPMDNAIQQNGGPTSHLTQSHQVLIYSQRKLVEDATVGQITPTPQYMIANVHNQKALSTNIMQPFTVEDPNVYTVNSKQFKNPYYSIYPNV